MKLMIIFATAAANITDSERYDNKGDDNQKSACRVYVVSVVERNKRARKITVCLQNGTDRRVSYKLYEGCW
jgi:hypothetical protein